MRTPYDDILHLPHHVSDTRPRMSIRDRAAQFSPFAALTGYEAAVRETARTTLQRIELSDGEKERLNERLRLLQNSIDRQPEVRITYFVPDQKKSGGAYVDVVGAVKKIDPISRLIIVHDGVSISTDEVIRIDGALFREIDAYE